MASILLIFASCFISCKNHQYEELKANFLDLPIEKKLTMPLFWQHGEEDDTLLNYVDRLIESGAGGFVVDGRVPAEHRARKLECSAVDVTGSQDFKLYGQVQPDRFESEYFRWVAELYGS